MYKTVLKVGDFIFYFFTSMFYLLPIIVFLRVMIVGLGTFCKKTLRNGGGCRDTDHGYICAMFFLGCAIFSAVLTQTS